MEKERLKNMYESIKLYLYIDKVIIDLFADYLGKGKIKKLIFFEKNKYETCSPNSPVEYFSKENVITHAKILTENNEIFIIKEEYLGINFEEPCDEYILTIFDKYGNVVGTTLDLDNYLEIKKQKKKKRFINRNK